MKVTVKMDLPGAAKVVQDLGLDAKGDVQRFHTNNVMRRIQRFMPYKSGAYIKGMIAATNINEPEIVIPGPHSRFLYHGKVMVSDVTGSPWARKGETKHVVGDWDINYNREKNPDAGPYYDREMVAAEGPALVEDIKQYMRQRK